MIRIFLKKYPQKIILRYVAFQIPTIFLVIITLLWLENWIEIPKYAFYGVITLWILKDLILFFFVWRAYDWSAKKKKIRLPMEKGIAIDNLNPEGYVRIGDEFWQARVPDKNKLIRAGEAIKVISHNGLTLIVEQEAGDDRR